MHTREKCSELYTRLIGPYREEKVHFKCMFILEKYLGAIPANFC